MKQTLFLLIVLFSYYSYGQNPILQNDSFKTEIERVVNHKNILLKKELIDLDRIKRVNFKFIKVYNFETKVTTKGLYIYPRSRRYKKTHYLDSTEIVAFFKCLLAMDTAKYNFNSRDALMYNIRSKDNFNILMKYEENDWVWKYSLFLNKKKVKKKGRRLNKKQFMQLITVFRVANGLLK